MSACRYRLVHVSIEPNLQGEPMRRLIFSAQPSESFGSTETNPHADGTISQRVTAAYADRFQLGDDFDVMFRERDK